MFSLPFRYHLLKLLQKFGKVKQFDFLFHKSGALEGQPRGYCFVNFETKQVSCFLSKVLIKITDFFPFFFNASWKLQQERMDSVLCLHKPTDSNSSSLHSHFVTAPGSSNSDSLSLLLSFPEFCFLMLTRKFFGWFCSWWSGFRRALTLH